MLGNIGNKEQNTNYKRLPITKPQSEVRNICKILRGNQFLNGKTKSETSVPRQIKQLDF